MKVLPRIALACLAVFMTHASATDDKPVRVDLLVFSQPAATGATYWQAQRPLPPCHAVALRDGGGAQTAFADGRGCERKAGMDAAFSGFSGTGSSQLGAQANKLKAGGYTVLANRGWRQAATSLSPVHVSGGRQAGTRQELEGTVSIGGTDRMPEVTLELTLTRMDGDTPQYVTLRETRRLKPGEANYFDHPLLGVILAIAPENVP